MKNKVLWQALNTLCGTLVLVFFLNHIFGVSTILDSSEMFDAYAKIIKGSVLVRIGMWIFLLGPLLFHALYGNKAASRVYSKPFEAAKYLAAASGSNKIWAAQIISGSLLVVFLAIHLWLNFILDGEVNANISAERIRQPAYLLFYAAFLAATATHAVIGIKLALAKYGVGKRARKIILGIVLAVFAVVLAAGIFNLVIFANFEPTHATIGR